MPDQLVTLSQLERRFGPSTVSRYLDDDGDDTSEQTVAEEVLTEASQVAQGICLPAFSNGELENMADVDLAFRGYILDIAADIMARRRVEAINEKGETPYSGIRKLAEEKLEKIADAKRRMAGEEQAGINRKVSIRTNIDRNAHPLVFPPTKNNPGGSGGF